MEKYNFWGTLDHCFPTSMDSLFTGGKNLVTEEQLIVKIGYFETILIHWFKSVFKITGCADCFENKLRLLPITGFSE